MRSRRSSMSASGMDGTVNGRIAVPLEVSVMPDMPPCGIWPGGRCGTSLAGAGVFEEVQAGPAGSRSTNRIGSYGSQIPARGPGTPESVGQIREPRTRPLTQRRVAAGLVPGTHDAAVVGLDAGQPELGS